MKIEIINWEKYNPKRDQKKYYWFRFNNDFFNDRKLHGLSAKNLVVWIYILCEASKDNSSTLDIDIKYIQSTLKVRTNTIIELLIFLKNKGIVHFGETLATPTIRRERNATNAENVSQGTQVSTRLVHEKDEAKPRRGGSLREQDPAENAKVLKSISEVAQVRKAFLDAYRTEFKTPYPGWGAKENGQVKNWLRSIGLAKALHYCALYPKWNDPWISRQGHPFGLLIAQYVKLDAWLSREASIIEKIAEGQARENVVLGKAQSFRELEMHVDESYKRREAENLIGGRAREDKLSNRTQAVLPSGSDDIFSRDPFINCAPEPNGFEPSDPDA